MQMNSPFLKKNSPYWRSVKTGMNESLYHYHENCRYEGSPPQGPLRGVDSRRDETASNGVSSHRNHENCRYEGFPPQGPSRVTVGQFRVFLKSSRLLIHSGGAPSGAAAFIANN